MSRSAWLDIVLRRQGRVSADAYSSLSSFISDFQYVNDNIRDQSKERHTVSYAVLVSGAIEASCDWLCDKFASELPNVHFNTTPEMSFVQNVLIPRTTMTPVLQVGTAVICRHNVELFKMLEKRAPAHMPCGVAVLNVKGFLSEGTMTLEDKFRVITSIKGTVTLKSVTKALKEMPDAQGVVVAHEPRDIEVVDVLFQGVKVTERRSSDSYVNVTMILRAVGSSVAMYMRCTRNQEFLNSIKSSVQGKELLELPENAEFGSAWAHPKFAEDAALWCGNADAVSALKGYVDDTVPVSTEESDADVALETVSVDGITTTRRSSDGYIQGSELGKSLGQKWANFVQSNRTRTLFEAISNETGIPVANLVYTGIGVKAGVWAHPKAGVAMVAKYRPESAKAFEEAVNAPFTAKPEFVRVKNAAGVAVSLMRVSDGFHDVNFIANNAPKKVFFSHFQASVGVPELIARVRKEYGKEVIEVTRGTYGGTWTHPVIARQMAERCGVVDLDVFEPEDMVEIIGETSSITCIATPDITVSVEGYVVNGIKVRKTDGTPPMISVYDIIAAVTGQEVKQASTILARIQDLACAEVTGRCRNFKFPGQGQRPTPVTDARGLVTIMNLLPGQQAAQFRLKAADVMVRYLGGDQTLISEIQRNAAAQDVLPEDNIGRLFGDAVAESSQAIVVASRAPQVTLDSVTGFIDMRGPQNYFRLTDSSLWSNVHPCGRPDLVMEPEELAKHAVVKIGCNGESTGRQPIHELALKGSKLLDSIPTKCYTYVEQRAKDVWKNNNELFEGTHWGKTTRDTELLLIRTQEQYIRAVELVQDLVEEAESSGDLKLQIEREKTKQADSAARIAEAEVRKLELEIELYRMRATSSQTHH